MGSDLELLIFDTGRSAIVARRWFGMSATVEALRLVLGRPPDHHTIGKECWGRVTVAEAAAIAESSYRDGPSPDEVAELARAFGDDGHWWMFVRDY